MIIYFFHQVTSPWAYTFIALNHNVTNTTEDSTVAIKYTTGWKDACAVFFYFLITIIMHAVFQEYIFDVSISMNQVRTNVFKLFIISYFTFTENFQAAASQ